jgi:hypothetical protein
MLTGIYASIMRSPRFIIAFVWSTSEVAEQDYS